MQQIQNHENIKVFSLSDLDLLIVTNQPLPYACRENGLDKAFNAKADRDVLEWPLIVKAEQLHPSERQFLLSQAEELTSKQQGIDIVTDYNSGKFNLSDIATGKTVPFYIGTVGLRNIQGFCDKARTLNVN